MTEPYPANYADIEVAAKTVYGEARGETYAGKLAVAWVIRNRAERARKFLRDNPGKTRHPLFGDGSFLAVCKARLQFSCWNQDDPNLPLLQAPLSGMWLQASFDECLLAVLAVKSGRSPDGTYGSTHYFDPRAANPKWALGLTPVCSIGNHRFYNNVP